MTEQGAGNTDASMGVGPNTIVAIIPAKNRADRIGATIRAVDSIRAVDQIVVVDDGSDDDTSREAVRTAAEIANRSDATRTRPIDLVRLPVNRGKGAALQAGIDAAPDAAVYLLVDADLGESAASLGDLLGPVIDDQADMAIAVPPPAGRRGGLGLVKKMASAAIRRGSGFETTTPLSGQRAVRGEVLRSMQLADRFGIETALTLDVARAGHRIVEVPIVFDHRHTGRRLAGFLHRARQGGDIVRALWSRLVSSGARQAVAIVLALVALVGSIGLAQRAEPSSIPNTREASKVVIFGLPRFGIDDLGQGVMPTLDRLAKEGAVAAASIRTRSGRPSTVEAYATIGAGSRVRARDVAADAYAPAELFEGEVSAREASRLRTGVEPSGSVVVVGAASTRRTNDRRFQESLPGLLGETLHQSGKTTAVVGNSDLGDVEADLGAGFQRPAAVAVMDAEGDVDHGSVASSLLDRRTDAPFGIRISDSRFLAATRAAIDSADVVVVDPGELDRAAVFKNVSTEQQAALVRTAALATTDRLLAGVVEQLPPKAVLLVLAVRPPTPDWELGPFVAWGHEVEPGYLHSPSARRLGLVTITDIAPTVLDMLGLETPADMIGHPLRLHPGRPHYERFRSMNDLARYRERLYLPLTKGYVVFQAVLYILTIVFFSSRGGWGRFNDTLRAVVLAIAGLPLATFVLRMIPQVWRLGAFGVPCALLIDVVIVMVAKRARRHPLSPLSWILTATWALILADLATGARLQQASVLGYSPHTAARFVGIGNAAFAVLAATVTLWAAIHVQYAPRRREALICVAAVCALAIVVDGAPMLGSDVGGIITMVPVFGLLVYVLTGRRLTGRVIAIGSAITVTMVALATGIDLLRPADQRTHLGRFVDNIRHGGGDTTFFDTVGRKLQTNVRVFTGSFWTWVVPIIVGVLLFFLVVQRGWERDMPSGSALRAGVVASLLAGLVGFSVNDSGTVVAALVFVYLGPYLTMLALARHDVALVRRDVGAVADAVP